MVGVHSLRFLDVVPRWTLRRKLKSPVAQGSGHLGLPLILTCGFSSHVSSRCGPALNRFCHSDGDRLLRNDDLACFPMLRPRRGLPFSLRGPRGSVPPLQRYSERLRLPKVPLAAFCYLHLAIPPTRRRFAPADRQYAIEGTGEWIFRFPSRI